MSAFSTLVENADTQKMLGKCEKRSNKTFSVMSAFSTIVVNVDTLKNARKIRKDAI